MALSFFPSFFYFSVFCVVIFCKYTPVSIKVAPVKRDALSMFHSLQCTMVNPFIAGSSVLFK